MEQAIYGGTHLHDTITLSPAGSRLDTVRRWAVPAAVAMSIVSFVLATGVSLAAWTAAIATTAVTVAAGVIVYRRAFPSETTLDALVWGGILGLTAGKYAFFTVGLLLGLDAATVIASLLLVMAGAIVLRSRMRPVPGAAAMPRGDAIRDLRPLLLLIAAIFVLLSIPFGRMGGVTPDGFAFVPYFGKDFFQHVSITAELSRSVPPQNPYFAGATLHYYWFSHLWPAAVFVLGGSTARDALLATTPVNVALFIGTLYLLLGGRIASRQARVAALALALFAPGFVGVLYVATRLLPFFARLIPNYSHIGYSFLSHSWFRDCLYEPHAIAALCVVMTAIHLTSMREASWRTGLAAGACAAAAVMTDAFIGGLGIVWCGLVALRIFVADRRSWPATTAMAVAGAAALLAGIRIGMFPVGGEQTLRIALHPLTYIAPAVLLADLGPLLVLGCVGFWLAYREKTVRLDDPLLILSVAVVVIAFTFRVPLDDDIVLRKSMKVLQIPLLVFSASAFPIWRSRRYTSVMRWGLAAAVAAGAITMATDLIQYATLTGPRTPAATYVGFDEMKALTWLRDNTPRDAVVQDVAEVRPGLRYRDTGDSAITAIGERRTLFGNYESPYTFRVPRREIDARVALLERLSAAHDPRDMQRAVKRVGGCYLLLNGRVRRAPVAEMRALVDAGALVEVFRSGDVMVLRRNMPTGQTANEVTP